MHALVAVLTPFPLNQREMGVTFSLPRCRVRTNWITMVVPFGMVGVSPYSITAPMFTMSSPWGWPLHVTVRQALAAMSFHRVTLTGKPVSLRALLEPFRAIVLSASFANGSPPSAWRLIRRREVGRTAAETGHHLPGRRLALPVGRERPRSARLRPGRARRGLRQGRQRVYGIGDEHLQEFRFPDDRGHAVEIGDDPRTLYRRGLFH